MKQITLFIALICMFTATGLQANTPDLKKNSKVELSKHYDVRQVETASVNENIFTFTAKDVASESNRPQGERVAIVNLQTNPENATISAQRYEWDSGGGWTTFYKKYTNLANTPTNDILHRNARDGHRAQDLV